MINKLIELKEFEVMRIFVCRDTSVSVQIS